MPITPLPKSENFYVCREWQRDSEPKDTVLTILYRGYHFGHTWQIPEDFGKANGAGQWTFNRGKVAINNEYWPPVYSHDTLEQLLAHLEATFVEQA